MRIVFMGTPSFAAQILEHLVQYKHGELVAVYAQPDRQAGRGKKLHEPETKTLANKLNIPVFQPQRFRNNQDAINELQALKPDILIVAAYGMLLPQEVLDIAPYGAFNIHTSLLPKYRGAAPVQRALMAGDTLTGVTIIRMEAGLDTGPILLQQAISIKNSEEFCDNSATLLEALAENGGKLMRSALNMIRENRVNLIIQDNACSTHAAKLTKQEAQINWVNSAEDIHNHIRGFSPNPGATAQLKINDKDPIQVRIEKGFVMEKTTFYKENSDEGVKFNAAEFYAQSPYANKNTNNEINENAEIPEGTVIGIYKNYIIVKTGNGHYGINQIRLAGKSPMDAVAFNNGYFKNNTCVQFVPKESL